MQSGSYPTAEAVFMGRLAEVDGARREADERVEPRLTSDGLLGAS
jgi:hypothetical protein